MLLKLQWGRTREGAEMVKNERGVPMPVGFNGAAPVKVRKSIGDSVLLNDGSRLQWGRTREGAEMPIAIW